MIICIKCVVESDLLLKACSYIQGSHDEKSDKTYSFQCQLVGLSGISPIRSVDAGRISYIVGHNIHHGTQHVALIYILGVIGPPN